MITNIVIVNYLYLFWISEHVDDGSVNGVLILRSRSAGGEEHNRVLLQIPHENLLGDFLGDEI